MAKIIVLDTETTGLSAQRNGIIQLSGIVEVDGQEKERFDYLIRPFEKDVISDDALKVNGRTREEIQGFERPDVVHKQFCQMLGHYVDRWDKEDKFQMIAYNARFDDEFLRAFFRKCGDKYYGAYISWPAIDVTNLIATIYLNRRHLFPSFKLMTVAEKLGIETDESRAHDATYDVEITMQIFKSLRKEIISYEQREIEQAF